MSNYKVFARFYDAVNKGQEKTSYEVLELIDKSHPSAKSLLDLACGTGSKLDIFSKKYKVSGLDYSKEMLSIARKKIPGAKFYLKDVVNFVVDKNFDVIVCLFDSVNHLLSFKEWKSLFSNVEKHLNNGGVFIFDINTKEKLNIMHKLPPRITKFQGGYLVMNVVKKGAVSTWEVDIFERKSKNNFVLHSEKVKEVSFGLERVERELKKTFSTVKSHMVSKLKNGEPARVYFICKKTD